MHARNYISSTFLKSRVLVSNQPEKSNHCLKSSLAAWDPNLSLNGIIRSSMKNTYFCDRGGPHTPFLRFSSLESRNIYAFSALVTAEYTIEYDLYFWLITGIYLNSISRESQLLPHPVGPISRRLFLATTWVSTIYPRRIVSIVGINFVNAEPFLLI